MRLLGYQVINQEDSEIASEFSKHDVIDSETLTEFLQDYYECNEDCPFLVKPVFEEREASFI